MKKILSFTGIVFVLIVAAIAGGFGKEVARRVFAPDPPSKEDFEYAAIQGLEQAAEQINQGAPTMVDAETRLDKATVGPGALMTYHYTFPNYTSDEVDSAWIRSEVRDRVMSNVCNSEEIEIKYSLQYGDAYSYTYYGSDQKVIGSFRITREDCGYAAVSP